MLYDKFLISFFIIKICARNFVRLMVIKFAAVFNLAKSGTRLCCRLFLLKKFDMVCVTATRKPRSSSDFQ
jgi:hypothetical protein